MNDQIQNVITTIFAVEDTGQQIKLKDSNKKSLGSFFKIKKDGNETQAYQQFKILELKSGSSVEIGFKEVPYKDGTVKNIIGFREVAGRPVPPVKAPQTQNSAPQRTFNGNDDYGRRLALHGFINARLVNNPISQVELEIDHLLKLEDKIENKLNTSKNAEPSYVEEEPPMPDLPF